MSWVSKGVKSVRRALRLPPITTRSVLTQYGPAAAMAATGNYAGAAATMYGGGAVPQRRPVGQGTVPGYNNPVSAPSGDADMGGGTDWAAILSSLAGTAGNFAKEHGVDLAAGGLAAWQMANAAEASRKAGKYQDAAIRGAKDRWATQEPLRKAGIAGMLNPERPDLTDVYTDPTNPFATPIRRPVRTPVPNVVTPPPFPEGRLPYPIPRNPARGATPISPAAPRRRAVGRR